LTLSSAHADGAGAAIQRVRISGEGGIIARIHEAVVALAHSEAAQRLQLFVCR